MDHDFALRAVLIVVMLMVLPFGVYHRIKSQSTGERLDRRQEGLFILATLRPLGAVMWLSVFAWMLIHAGWPGRRCRWRSGSDGQAWVR